MLDWNLLSLIVPYAMICHMWNTLYFHLKIKMSLESLSYLKQPLDSFLSDEREMEI